MSFEFEDLQDLYDEEVKRNPKAYENLPTFLEKVEKLYVREKEKDDFKGDMGQSWRSWNGQNFEKLMIHILSRLIDDAGIPLELIRGSILEKQQNDSMLGRVKRNILVDLGIYGCHMPDADIVVYDPSDASVKAIISCKISLRERIAQTAYWKLRLRSCPVTRHIKMFFLTPDKDKTLENEKIDKSKAIVLHELDVAYILRENFVEQHNLRRLERITEDLQ